MSFLMPRRRQRTKMGLRDPSFIKCPGHLKWVRGHECLCAGKMARVVVGEDYALVPHECLGKIEVHHVTSRGAGGGDEQVVPLCSRAHADGHRTGWATFEQRYRLDLASTAAGLWKRSPHRLKYERKTE